MGGEAVRTKCNNCQQYGPVDHCTPVTVFWSRVDQTDTCWNWTHRTSAAGYGRHRVAARDVSAHRFAYELLIGPIPEGLQLDHLCRNTSCVNPDHLEPVTARENTLRGFGPSSINAKKTHCLRGHEFTPENTRIEKRNGGRVCRECKRIRNKAEKAAMRARRKVAA